jgi:hypothetical protein
MAGTSSVACPVADFETSSVEHLSSLPHFIVMKANRAMFVVVC